MTVGAFVDHDAATWCAACSRYRVSCTHQTEEGD